MGSLLLLGRLLPAVIPARPRGAALALVASIKYGCNAFGVATLLAKETFCVAKRTFFDLTTCNGTRRRHRLEAEESSFDCPSAFRVAMRPTETTLFTR
jgi:hypothetical protein